MHKQQMESSRQPAVGLLTTEQRDKWTDSYKLLRKLSPRNAESLDCIEQSLFAVCLETFAAADDIDVSHRVYFHGQGGANRWFDKSWSFIFMNDGRGGCSGEHSPSDAVIPGRIIGDVLSRYDLTRSFEILLTLS